MTKPTKRYERTDVYAETFHLKATDDLVKLQITNLKEENASLKRSRLGRAEMSGSFSQQI